MFNSSGIVQLVLLICFLIKVDCSQNRPNIIVVIADDLGWNDVSFHGSNQIQTPNIDGLAYNGIILNSHYVPALCTPSRASFLTGKYPTSMGMQHLVILAPEPWGLPLEETLMPQFLKRHGYATHAIGKWHLGFHEKEYTPIYRGFDSHFGYWNGFQDYYDHTMQSESVKGYDMRRDLDIDYSSKGLYSTDVFTDEAVSIIKNHNSTQGPLFLYLSHLAPHAGNPDEPFQAPEEEIAKHLHIKDPERRIYAAMVTKLDESLGRVMSALKSADMLDNSIVLFLSDNGAVTFGMHSNRGSNYPLRGLKESPWEGGVRGVAAIWSPLLNQTGRVSNQMMHMSDWLPTLYSAAGLNTSELGNIDGMNMWDILSHNLDSPRVEVFNNYDEVEDYSSLRVGSWKYIEGTAQGGEVDQWYGESGEDNKPVYEISKVLESETNKAISSFLKNKMSQREFEEGKFLHQLLTKESIYSLRDNSMVTCDYPLFSSLSLLSDNHTYSKESEDSDVVKFDVEDKKKIILELEKIFQESTFDVEDKKTFSSLEWMRIGKLIDSGELKNYLKCDPLKTFCLFNLDADPCERLNLAKIFPKIVQKLQTRLKELKETVVKPLNQPEDPFSNPQLHNGTWANWCDIRKEKSQIFVKILLDSFSSAFRLHRLDISFLDNFKTFFYPFFLSFKNSSIYHSVALQPPLFFWLGTFVISAITILYGVNALK